MSDNAAASDRSDTPILPVVLSGGSGSRLWPESRRLNPKQFLALVDERSMIRATIDRVTEFVGAIQPIIVTNADHADAAEKDMADAGFPDVHMILEPVGRNTAPAVAVAALKAVELGDPLLLILPADHTIENKQSFHAAIRTASEAAHDGFLVTFGISPSEPDTGYGYLKVGEPIGTGTKRVEEFKEKPDEATAREYVESGRFLWNSGIFLFRASTYLQQLETFAPDIAEASARAFRLSKQVDNRQYLDEASFASCRADSIDYAVMEKTDIAVVVPMDPGWSDVGSWKSLWEIAQKDEDDNALIGDVIAVGTTESYVKAPHRLVATVGVDRLIVVDTPDAVLIASMDAAQDVKAVVDVLEAADRPESERSTIERQPWGAQQILGSGTNHVVRHLWIDPGQSAILDTTDAVSVSFHVMQGSIRISVEGVEKDVAPGESTNVVQGDLTRLTNHGVETAEIVEVEIRSTLGHNESIST